MKGQKGSILKNYILLTKPGIIIGNLITCAAGFFLASAGVVNYSVLVAVIAGTTFIIGGSCVVNNYLDRGIDSKMERTKKRALATGKISVHNAMFYAAALEIIGFLILYLYTNILTVVVGAVGVFFYVVMYSIWKRRSIYSTIIGSVSGAIPPVAGYVAVSNKLDLGAVILFMMLVLWQMPHFYAIGIYRLKDYAAAKIPILPVVKSIKEVKIHILFFVICFVIVSTLLTFYGYTGYAYLGAASLLGLRWLMIAVSGFRAKDDRVWARSMFKFSLTLITLLCVAMSIDSVR